MLKVHKGRRDDVRMKHGPHSGLTHPFSYLIGLGRRSPHCNAMYLGT